MRRMSTVVALVALIGISSGCYHHHLRANGERVNSSPFRKTLGSSGGNHADTSVPPVDKGAQGKTGLPSSADCKENGLYEVGVTSYWKDAAGTVFSFGRWSRVKVEWVCAKEPPVIGPRGLGSQPPAPVEAARPPGSTGAAIQPPQSKANQDDFTKRTVHAFFWGGLQQNLLPPPSPNSKTPANCKSMRQVKLPMNYSYALITVFTAGIWSPMRVAWKCNEDTSGASSVTVPELPGVNRPLIPRSAPLFPPAARAASSLLSSKE